MDLYFSPISAYSHKVLMAFYEKDIKFQPVKVDLADSAVMSEYRQFYPLGKVPCLKTHNEWIPESSNIIEWLDEHFQVTKLIPTKNEEARKVRLLDRLADQYLAANAITLFFQSLRPAAAQDQERIETAKRQIRATYETFEQCLEKNQANGDFIYGNSLSLADISLLCSVIPSLGFVPLAESPRLAAYIERHQQRPSLLRARAGFEEAVVAMIEARRGN